MAHNPHPKASRNYSVVDDLAQSPATISALEVLQTFLPQRKILLTYLKAINPSDS